MINNNHIAIFDIESSSTNPWTTQPLSLGAVIVDARKLEIVPGSEFYSEIQPTDPDKVEKGALEVNKLNLDSLMEAPPKEVVFAQFSEFINKYSKDKRIWSRPIPCGYNIIQFDLIIINRLCHELGYIDNSRNCPNIFHPVERIDIMHDIFRWTENTNDLPNKKLDTVREWLGLPKENAHHALQDCIDTARIACRFLGLYRRLYTKVNFKNAFAQQT